MLDNLQSQTQEPHYQNSFTKPIIFVLEQNSIEKIVDFHVVDTRKWQQQFLQN